MKKHVCLGLVVLLCICPLLAAAAVEGLRLQTQDGRVTARYESFPVADWVPGYCETYTVDMELPAAFPSFTIAQVRPYYPQTKATKAAIEPLLPTDEALRVKIRVNDQDNHCQLSSALNGLWTSGHFRDLAGHRYENHPRQAEIDQAIGLVKGILDAMGISYEFPFFTVLRSEDWADTVRAENDRPNLTNRDMVLPHVFRAQMIDSPEYDLRFPGYTIIRARFAYGGLPCGENAFSQDAGSPSGGSYAGGGGVMEFIIDDAGQLLKGQMNFAQEVTGEEAFTGQLLTWEEALAAYIAGNEAVMRGIGKGWWLEYGLQSAENPNTYHIAGMSPGCTFQDGKTRPVWLLNGTSGPGTANVVWMVDAQTGELYQ